MVERDGLPMPRNGPRSGAGAAWLDRTAGREETSAVRVSAEPVFRWWDFAIVLSGLGLAAIWNFAGARVRSGGPTQHPFWCLLAAALLAPFW